MRYRDEQISGDISGTKDISPTNSLPVILSITLENSITQFVTIEYFPVTGKNIVYFITTKIRYSEKKNAK